MGYNDTKGHFRRKIVRLTGTHCRADAAGMLSHLTRRSLLAALAASPALAQAPSMAGMMSVETIDSRFMREPRRLTVYRPSGWAAGQVWPVVYMADGQFLEPYVQDVDALIAAGRLRPLLIVGLWSG